jgi:hypothetical protein
VAGIDDRRHVHRARHRVVHERAGDELAIALVIDGVFHQRLPDTLRERADKLTFGKRVVEDHTRIIDRRIGDDLGDAGVRIDLDLGNMAAVRERLRRVDGGLGVERVAGRLGALRDREQRDAPVGADDLEMTFTIGHIGIGRLQHPAAIGFAFSSIKSAAR